MIKSSKTHFKSLHDPLCVHCHTCNSQSLRSEDQLNLAGYAVKCKR